jgi:hypothetical protein
MIFLLQGGFMARGNKQQPVVDEQEEMTVIVLQFKGSGDSLSRGFDAVAHALAAIRPTATPAAARGLAARPKQLAVEHPGDDVESDPEEDEQEPVSDVVPRAAKRTNDVPRKRSSPKFDSTLDLDKGQGLKAYCNARNPNNDNERYLVAAAWLTEEGGRPKFKATDVFTCFRGMSWSEQKDFTQPLRQMKSKKSYFESLGKGDWELTGLGLKAAKAINNPVT